MGMHLPGNRALAAVSGADMTIGVTCTLRGAQATKKGCTVGTQLMCRLKFEECQPTDFQQQKSPPDMDPLDISLLLNLRSRQKSTHVGGFDQ